MLNKDQVIAKYHMLPHPEGGYYVETFRSSTRIQTPSGEERSSSTAILFLLSQHEASHLHRIKSEEVWHFYAGGPISIFELIEETGGFKVTQLGPDIEHGHVLQHVVPANVWFGAYVEDPSSSFSLVGCTVAPGFEFGDFELASRQQLLVDFPAATEVIHRLTRD